jgi:tetratricopeptide (TPR) repeat protein
LPDWGFGLSSIPDSLRRFAAEKKAASAFERLPQPPGIVVEDYRPICQSLDWQLGQLYFEREGHRSFLDGSVPYLVNNDGFLSTRAAELLYEGVSEREARDGAVNRVMALELGVGSGLFARGFLRAFERICSERGKTYHRCLTFIAADRSKAMLEDLRRHELLSGFSSDVRLARADASELAFEWLGDPLEGPLVFDGVFLNYVLDCLPASVIRVRNGVLEQLTVRTELTGNRDPSAPGADEIVRRARGNDTERVGLIDLYHLFVLRYRFEPAAADEFPGWSELAATVEGSGHILHSHGAVQCLEAIRKRLGASGFVLISDYQGLHAPEAFQHFGASTAIGINLAQFAHHFQGIEDLCWVAPEPDHESITVRLLSRTAKVSSHFQRLLNKATIEGTMNAVTNARAHRDAGRFRMALGCFREASQAHPENWMILTEAAHICQQKLHDHAAALELGRAAAALNPINPSIWNTVGDSLYSAGRHDEAHEAFAFAASLNPNDVRARYNTVYTHTSGGRLTEALTAIAEALARDSGEYRDRLLSRQREILGRLANDRQRRSQRICDRNVWTG